MSETKSKSVQLSDRAATVGRTLLYTYTGEEHEHMAGRAICSERPAVIVRAWGDTPGSAYNIQVLTDCGNDVEGGGPGADGTLWLQSIQIAAEPTPGYLHWPELTAAPKTKALPPPVVPGDVVTVPGEGDLKVTDVAADGSMTAEPVAPKAPKAKKSKRRAG